MKTADILKRRIFVLLGALSLALAMGVGGPAFAIEWDDYEYEPGEGLHEEEWYDPSDWFDVGQGISFEDNDWWDYGYGYGEPGVNGAYGNNDLYGNYGGQEEYYGMSPAYTEDDYGTGGYYTEDWNNDDGVFDGWFE